MRCLLAEHSNLVDRIILMLEPSSSARIYFLSLLLVSDYYLHSSLFPHTNNKQPRKLQQHAPIRIQRIRLPNFLQIASQKLLPPPLLPQRIQKRPQPALPQPTHNRLVPIQPMIIRRMPHIHGFTQRTQRIINHARRRQRLPPRILRALVGEGPPRLPHQRVARLPHIIRHLHRKHATTRLRAHPALHARQQLPLRQPVQRGVRVQQIHACAGLVSAQVRQLEGRGRQRGAGHFEHVRARVDAGDARVGAVAGGQEGGRVGGPAAEVDDARGGRGQWRDGGEEVARRAGALRGEAEVVGGVPVGGRGGR